MKAPLLVSVLFCSLMLPGFVLAQSHSGGGGGTKTTGGTPTTSVPRFPGATPSNPAYTSSVFISGKVALDDGTQLSDPAAIQTICTGQRHTVAYTDSHGSFSFQLGDPTPMGSVDLTDASTNSLSRSDSSAQLSNWQSCQLQAVLAGFSSEVIELTSRMNNLESADIGRIGLHRLQQVEGTSISVTSALAPSAARKALEKARNQEKKGKWKDAQRSLEQAVTIYPKYAVAWNELGGLQIRQNDWTSAKQSFQQSIAADAKYVNPYDGLAQIAFQGSQWKDVVDTTTKLLALNPVNFPQAYLMNGIAEYYLHDFDAGEKIARQGIRVDDGHQFPKLQYLLGMILLRKGNYPGATEYMEQYLHLVKQPSDVEEANKRLAEIARLSATPSSAAATEKK